jgi:hypothetical protein
MKKCPKCAFEYDGDVKICRTCGAILEPYSRPTVQRKSAPADEAELITAENVFAAADVTDDDVDKWLKEDPPNANDGQPPPAWICPQCQKSNPGNFDICWKCFSSRDGELDPEYAPKADTARSICDVEEDEEADEDDVEEITSTSSSRPSCSKCGSERVIRNARVLDQGQQSDGHLQVMIFGNPEALVFKDRLYGKLTADICGECGYVEFRVLNPSQLYEHYLKSRR